MISNTQQFITKKINYLNCAQFSLPQSLSKRSFQFLNIVFNSFTFILGAFAIRENFNFLKF